MRGLHILLLFLILMLRGLHWLSPSSRVLSLFFLIPSPAPNNITVRGRRGENLGYFRLKRGENQLGVETMCSWALPGPWTTQNYPCFEDGSNC